MRLEDRPSIGMDERLKTSGLRTECFEIVDVFAVLAVVLL